MKLIPILCAFLISNLTFGQRDTLAQQKSLVNQLRNLKRVEIKHIGFAGMPSENYKIAQSLWDVCSIPTLVKLTDDSSPIVRCYSLLGLIEKNAKKEVVKSVVDKHQNDSTVVSTMSGCIVWSMPVSLYMGSNSRYYLMTEEQRKKELEFQDQRFNSDFGTTKETEK